MTYGKMIVFSFAISKMINTNFDVRSCVWIPYCRWSDGFISTAPSVHHPFLFVLFFSFLFTHSVSNFRSMYVPNELNNSNEFWIRYRRPSQQKESNRHKKRQIARNGKHREHYNDIDQIKTAFEWESMLWAGDFHETINWRMSGDHEFDIFVGEVMTFFSVGVNDEYIFFEEKERK